MSYGMPYVGSKNKIARSIISLLPPGKRFVDLFGGGGAMTHCAVLSGKYESVLYNEVLPLVADTFRKAIDGYYTRENFTPRHCRFSRRMVRFPVRKAMTHAAEAI